MISHLGAMISVVNGALMAHRFKGIHGTVGATSIGDGSTSTGSCHEALNQAAKGMHSMAIHSPGSAVEVWVIPTDEGRVAAEGALACLG